MRFAAILIFAALVVLRSACAGDDRTTVIENEVSHKADWAAGSFVTNDQSKKMLELNTRPKDGDLLSKAPSKMTIKGTAKLWMHPIHTNVLHKWDTADFAGERIFVKVVGSFLVPPSGGGEKEWASNSLDVDIDVKEQPVDNTQKEDLAEMNPRNYVLKRNQAGASMLRKLPPQVAERLDELKPVVWIERSHDGVDLKIGGASIFPNANATRSMELQDKILNADLKLEVEGAVIGDCIMTARFTFTDPSSGYSYEFRDSVRITIDGKLRVDIDVDWNRNGKVEDDADDPHESDPVDFLNDNGALALVNCDNDGGVPRTRDMDDFKVNGEDDKLDMSPVSLELEEDLAPGEQVWLVIRNVDGSDAWADILDPTLVNEKKNQLVVAHGGKPEERMDGFAGRNWFEDRKKKRIDGRFLFEGLRFAYEVAVDFEIRNANTQAVIERDTVVVLNCPWLANNNTQPLVNPRQLKIPGNMTNSNGYQFQAGHGAQLAAAGAAQEFVQDSAEWGFQVRREKPSAQSRTMVTALRLNTLEEDKHPQDKFLNGKVGVYGYNDDDERYFEKGNSGDSGGNLDCLPPPLGGPFGRILHGDTMSGKLRAFLARQRVQVLNGAAILPITQIGLVHVDEIVCIAPKGNGFAALMPDWKLGKNILAANQGVKHNVEDVQPGDATSSKDTYGDILKALQGKEAKAMDAKFEKAMDGLQSQMQGFGATVVELPGMFFKSYPFQKQRAFPRNIANSQPTVGNKLIVSEPPQQGLRQNQESAFLREWKRILRTQGIVAESESALTAWKKGGEVHCSSNGIREPIKK